ncbi:MAG TPA: PQQ-binding-like beta-propeller repeat protein, partial [Pirellula sp.]|nr:PQQ-binding-like beta-propeller repeat protein [Pirellula sp.]
MPAAARVKQVATLVAVRQAELRKQYKRENRQMDAIRRAFFFVSKRILVWMIFAVLLFEVDLLADWPGLLGPTRNGHAESRNELPKAIEGSPKQIWKVEAGQGYAGPAIAGNDFVLFERVGDSDRVRLLNLETGKEVWRRDLKAGYRGGIDSDKGPRSVPAIIDNLVLVYSAAGDLTLLARKDGAVLWTRPLRKEYQAEDGYFGAGSTPLVVSDQAIISIGGKSASVVCVSLANGKTLWVSSNAEASYASPILIEPRKGSAVTKRIVVAPMKLKTLGLDLETGKPLWEFPFGQRGPTVNAATPVVTENGDLFLTSSYGIGSLLVRPTQSTAKIVQQGTDISSQYSTPVVLGGRIFGSDGREDGGEGTYKCLQASDGKLLWSQPNMP